MDTREAFAILADTDRQHIITELLENDGRSTVGILADRLAARQRNHADDLERDRAELCLVHNHLPRLADHGVLAYDRTSGAVVLQKGAALEQYLSDTTRTRPTLFDP